MPDQIICFYSGCAPAKRANAVCLICSWQLLYLDRSTEEAFYGFQPTSSSSSSSNSNSATATSSSGASSDSHEHERPENSSLPPLSRRANPTISPLPSFHDASPCSCTYQLTVIDCLKGLAKARHHNFFNFDKFDVEEYEHFEQVEVSCWC